LATVCEPPVVLAAEPEERRGDDFLELVPAFMRQPSASPGLFEAF
jgi:hypothetical protein